jgi:hypothetical protein
VTAIFLAVCPCSSSPTYFPNTCYVSWVYIIYIFILYKPKETGSSVSIVSGYGLDDRAIAVRSRQKQRIFPLTSVSRPALRPTQPPVQWVSGPGRGTEHSSKSSAEVVNE